MPYENDPSLTDEQNANAAKVAADAKAANVIDADGYINGSPREVVEAALRDGLIADPVERQKALDALAKPKAKDVSELPVGQQVKPGYAPGVIDPIALHPSANLETADKAAAAAQDTVLMLFPHPVKLTVTHARQIQFQAGVQPVETGLSTHPYLIANGVKAYNQSAPRDDR